MASRADVKPRRKTGRAEPRANPTRGERLQRIIADSGIASRRVSEALIEQGRVAVNGRLVSSLPAFADPRRDTITVDGRPLPRAERRVYLMLNKPARTLSTSRDEPGA